SVAQVLVEEGTLKLSQYVVAGVSYAKIRNLESTDNKPLKIATPAMPVLITGFKSLPEFGDEFTVVNSEKEAKIMANKLTEDRKTSGNKLNMGSNELIRLINRDRELSELNIIIKADVQGSLTSVISSLKALDTAEVAVRIVGTGIGPISENDLYLAITSNALIYGFNVPLSSSAKQQANRDKIKVRLYNVIYELIDDVKEELSNLLTPQIVENELGTLEIKGVFKTTKTEIICGGEVTKGKLTQPSLVKILKDKKEIAQAELTNLQKGPNEVKEVVAGEMCGLRLKTTKKITLEEGDKLVVFTRETVQRKL
ncbi:MAG TPA: translation initiation factor IF-2, partial [Patescibacteria group bacterium]|nr:translation initiation factor IF-2 [Patescibacteria group bacterium]